MAVDGKLPPGEWPKPKSTREWNCRRQDAACTRTVPCVACRGARNRRSGMRKQREARKAIERATGTQAARFKGQLGNEEGWAGLPFRVEVKSGGQAKPVQTFHDRCAIQSAQNKAIGDTRPFLAVAMPTGGGMYWVIHDDLVQNFAEAILNGYIA